MILPLFYVAAAIALVSTAMALSRTNAAHALIFLIMSLLSVAVIFFIIGAPFAAALEIVIYAGAIMVLFVFVIMMLNLGESGQARERQWLQPGAWMLPGLFALILLGELLLLQSGTGGTTTGGRAGLDAAAGGAGRRLPCRSELSGPGPRSPEVMRTGTRGSTRHGGQL